MKYLKVLSLTFVFLFLLASNPLLAFNTPEIQSVSFVEKSDLQELNESSEEPSFIAIQNRYTDLLKCVSVYETKPKIKRLEHNTPYKPPSYALNKNLI